VPTASHAFGSLEGLLGERLVVTGRRRRIGLHAGVVARPFCEVMKRLRAIGAFAPAPDRDNLDAAALVLDGQVPPSPKEEDEIASYLGIADSYLHRRSRTPDRRRRAVP
jgi:hypothetical protein